MIPIQLKLLIYFVLIFLPFSGQAKSICSEPLHLEKWVTPDQVSGSYILNSERWHKGLYEIEKVKNIFKKKRDKLCQKEMLPEKLVAPLIVGCMDVCSRNSRGLMREVEITSQKKFLTLMKAHNTRTGKLNNRQIDRAHANESELKKLDNIDQYKMGSLEDTDRFNAACNRACAKEVATLAYQEGMEQGERGKGTQCLPAGSRSQGDYSQNTKSKKKKKKRKFEKSIELLGPKDGKIAQ